MAPWDLEILWLSPPEQREVKVNKPTGGTKILPDQKSLLTTGLFSDVVVKCESREWKLHRSVICPQSDFFEKALCGSFQEASDREVVLREVRADELDQVVQWLYQPEDILPLQLFSDPTILKSCVTLYELADYLGIPSLKKASLQQLRQCLQYLTILVQTKHYNPVGFKHYSYPSDHKPADGIMRTYAGRQIYRQQSVNLVDAIEQAFTRGTVDGEIQTVFIDMVEASHFWVIDTVQFADAVAAVPQFASAVFKRLIKVGGRPPAALDGKSHECANCGREALNQTSRYSVIHAMMRGLYWAPLEAIDFRDMQQEELLCTKCEKPVL